MSVGARIKELRKAYGFTQKEIAERAGIATVSLQQYERGVRQPRIDQLTKISNALQVPLSHFVDAEPIAVEIISPEDVSKEDLEKMERDYKEFANVIEYLKSIGYVLSIEIADGGDELYYTLRRIENNSLYVLSEDEVKTLSGNISQYTRFLLQEILKNKPSLEAKPRQK